MTWLRLDDGFAEHPKVLALGNAQARWAWVEVLTYCARRKTGGRIPSGIEDVLKRATPAFLKRCEQVGLVENNGNGLVVHDWDVYNGALGERVAEYLEKHPDATANEVVKALGANRKTVLRLINALRKKEDDDLPF
jgi:predicted DNA-binding transcriptional regulator AlpA